MTSKKNYSKKIIYINKFKFKLFRNFFEIINLKINNNFY